MRFLRALAVGYAFAAQIAALSVGGKKMIVERDSNGLQNIVSVPAAAASEIAGTQ